MMKASGSPALIKCNFNLVNLKNKHIDGLRLVQLSLEGESSLIRHIVNTWTLNLKHMEFSHSYPSG